MLTASTFAKHKELTGKKSAFTLPALRALQGSRALILCSLNAGVEFRALPTHFSALHPSVAALCIVVGAILVWKRTKRIAALAELVAAAPLNIVFPLGVWVRSPPPACL